ncbi:MAG TPA: amidohydrolase [Acidimicrobiia bacterium]|nr:amidohydrolase [Acidimicrobiia bacterium]
MSPDSAWLDDFLEGHHEELVAFRRHLHAHPELSSEEHETTASIAERLRAAGLSPRLLSSGTGLWCDIGPGDGPIVALRADIDALAMDDLKDVPYRSRIPGVAHACGHDVHTTVVLGAGLALAPVLERGTVRLIFEPAEETVPGGALTVIADGVLDGVSAVFAFHCDPKLDVGTVGTRVGPVTSATDAVTITLVGPGGHTARPQQTVDLVPLAGRVAAEVPAAVQRAAGDVDLLLAFGAIHAGDAANVIPTTAELRGSLRTPDIDLWNLAPTLLDDALEQLLGRTGAAWSVQYARGTPPTVNTEAETAVLEAAVSKTLGADARREAPRSMGGDSFAWYLERVPGSYARLGVHDPARGEARLDIHAGTFDVHEAAIPIGVRVLAEAAVRSIGIARG